jgi:hypothetical protein
MVYKQAWSIKNYRYVGDVSMYQTKIQGNDWVRYGLAPMTTTQIVRS